MIFVNFILLFFLVTLIYDIYFDHKEISRNRLIKRQLLNGEITVEEYQKLLRRKVK